MILSRQNVTSVTDGSAVKSGAGIVGQSVATPKAVLLATGSEVGLCAQAQVELKKANIQVQVVSMPSWDRFERLGQANSAKLFPQGVPVISVEAGVTFGWHKYTDHTIGIDRFGASAPGAVAMSELGVSVDAVVTMVKSL
ncbi:MAG: transketolase-like TK C-terminal-containing protein [Actinomycetota bacterium]